MANFSEAVKKVLDLEGGYQDFVNDTGNYNSRGELVGTNRGISAPVYESWIGRPPSREEMKAITRATAEEIYRKKYWLPIQGDRINPQYLAEIIFDGKVNQGQKGIMLLQEALGVPADGIIGPNTLAAISRVNPARLHDEYKRRRIAFYRQLAASNSSYSQFLAGWLNRMDNFKPQSQGSALPILLLALGFIAYKNRYSCIYR